MNNTKKLYTLYTSIDNYKNANIPNLNGCINDAKNIAQYIAEASTAQNWQLHSLKLYNEKATKVNIVKEFSQHLGQATESDICLFYFSGHGGQETAHPAFIPHESDGKLEVLACYDSDRNLQGSFLADKELRYLIHQLYQKTKAQIITIFDCCHSGSNTKNPLFTIRRLMNDAQTRKWKDFIFHNAISQDDVQNTVALENILPQGKHIQLAACEDKESAYEDCNCGVFTSNLVKLLRQTKGSISYQNLVNILQLKIKGSYLQTPQLYAKGDDSLIFQSFLGGLTEHQKQLANIVFNEDSGYWLLDMGAIHGMNQSNPDLKIEIQNLENQYLGVTQIKAIFPNHTSLDIDKSLNLHHSKVYKASIKGIITTPLNIYCYGEKEGVEILEAYFYNNASKAKNITLVNTPNLADYFVFANNDAYAIQLPLNGLAVVEPLKNYNKSLEKLLDYLRHIEQWLFIKNLHNPHTQITPDPPLDIHFLRIQNQKDTKIEIKNNKTVIPFQYIPDKESKEQPKGEIRIKIKNNTKTAYYCALPLLSGTIIVKQRTIAL